MFQVTTLDLNNLPQTEEGKVDYAQDFFGKPCNLTVSGQLEGELGALSLGRIYTFGPTFRAENSNTPRHASEFWMIEPERPSTNWRTTWNWPRISSNTSSGMRWTTAAKTSSS